MESKKKGAPPKLNKFMHQRNRYRTPPSFKKLATQYPEFREHCTYDLSGKVHLDFKNPKAVRALTTCLLDQDFGLKSLYLMTHAARYDSEHMVVGADIGVGAACIYPLLGAKQFGWCMLGTETDQLSYGSATTNVLNNNLQDRVFVKKVENGIILKGVLDEKEAQSQILESKLRRKQTEDADLSKNIDTTDSQTPTQTSQSEMKIDGSHCTSDSQSDKLKAVKNKNEELSTFFYDFTMCNPPFFSSEEEMDTMKKSRKDRGEPVSAATGAVHEKVTAGGEITFVTQMIKESQLLKDKIRIFTTLIGSKAHVKPIKTALNGANPTCSVLTEFCQGRTMRWGIAWSFDPTLHLDYVKSKKDIVTNKPLVLIMPRSLMTVYSVMAAWNMIKKWLQQLKAFKATWLHQRRKKREDMKKGMTTSKGKKEIEEHNSEENEATDHDITRLSLKRKRERLETSQLVEQNEEEQKRKNPKICVGSTYDENINGSGKALPMEQTSSKRSCSSHHLDILNSQSENSQEIGKQESLEIVQEKEKQHNLGNDKMERSDCILRCNFQVKQLGRLINMEAYFLDGSSGKDGLNQLLQFMRNQLTKPTP
ncbi:RNA N6-adenosine-methyltransferase METTL16-like [Homarus americanus]|uniref:U6 small nuclear RNA (adenine-(43)-N(6))-methyltransferase n=1 Tax=Homarus americanus TaxID=6706 RepID=A0A8J5JZZ4_HOMAM|nr:RNA N6-adenosine-methyltransferase METTL16-like [Homarus americanus]